MNKTSLIELLFQMYRIRQVEFKIVELYSEQEMRCPVHLSIGQEAVAVGICNLLCKDDNIISAHRSHHHYIAKGGNLNKMIAELYGKESGCSKGKGGSMHLVDIDSGIIAAVPIVGSTIPIGVGAAWGKKLKKENDKTVIFFGDGATETGVFHESLGFASLHNIPLIFVCENNFYSVYSNTNVRQSEKRNLKKIVEGHGIKYLSGYGNDVEAINQIGKEAVKYIEDNNAPIFLEFDTYRWLEHCGPNDDDHLEYRNKEEIINWRGNCPIDLLKTKLVDSNQINQEQIDQYLDKLNQEIEEAFKSAKLDNFLSKESIFEDIYLD